MTFPLPVDYRQLSPGSSPAQDEDLEFADALDPQSGKKLPRKLGAEKRAVHNKIERARRESLNGRFQVSPSLHSPATQFPIVGSPSGTPSSPIPPLTLSYRPQQLAAALPMSNVKKDKRASKSAIVSQALAFVCTAQVCPRASQRSRKVVLIVTNSSRNSHSPRRTTN